MDPYGGDDFGGPMGDPYGGGMGGPGMGGPAAGGGGISGFSQLLPMKGPVTLALICDV
jgi:hypothetical protein